MRFPPRTETTTLKVHRVGYDNEMCPDADVANHQHDFEEWLNWRFQKHHEPENIEHSQLQTQQSGTASVKGWTPG